MTSRTTMKHAGRLAAAAAALAVLPAAAQGSPVRPLRLVVALAPGGNIDLTARALAPGLSELLGQPVVVENHGGAGGRTGTELVARAAPDGQTVLMGSSGALTISPAFIDRVGYDTLRDFAPLSLVSVVPLALGVHAAFPARSVKELVAIARERAGRVTMASAGTGTHSHLAGEMFQMHTGLKLVHVPYKGSAPALIDVVSGQVDLLFDQLTTSLPLLKTGKLKALAVTTQSRSSLLPQVPTLRESGLRDYEISTYTALMLPVATPQHIVAKLQDALLRVLERPATREAFARLGADVLTSTPEETKRRLAADIDKWLLLRQRTDIRIE